MSEFEREIIWQRTVEGLKAARTCKKIVGRPKGLTKSAQQKAYTASALYRAGILTTTEIGEQLNISVPTLYNYLKNQNIVLKTNALAYEGMVK